MARVLIVGGGCRGRLLAGELAREGHTLRITSRSEQRREAIEAVGAECWIGTPERLGTLRAALESVTLACWLLGSASGSAEHVRELHEARLEAFVRQLIDTTVRGFVYEAAAPGVPASVFRAGQRIARTIAEQNAIPIASVNVNPANHERWMHEARAAVARLLDR